MADTEKPPLRPEGLQPRKKGLTRRQKQRLSRGVQYAVFVAAVAAFAVAADWGRLRNQFAQADIAERMFPDVITLALKNTVLYTVTGFTVGLVLGMVIALMRLSSVGPYRWLAGIYIEIFRGLPALLIFIFIGVAVPLAFPGTEIVGGTYGQVALALGLVAAAYMAETIRAGIEAVPRGQMEAARSLGMRPSQAMFSIILPQAFRIIIPPLTNEFVLLIKDTSLLFVVGTTPLTRELTKFGRDTMQTLGNATPMVVAAFIYLVITLPLTYLVRRLEKRGARGR